MPCLWATARMDSDTELLPGTAKKLIGALLHPLNRPVTENGVVVRGHGVLQPRISVDLAGAGATDFSRVFAGPGGVDPYGGACGELYMDLFARGGFAGKGILDVDALLACCGGRFPENRVLSHDALEGAYLRGGFLGEAEVTDGFPGKPLSYFRRLHRWTRGDWQNLPWMFRRGRDLSDIDRFKLFDSLRRSLVAPATFGAVFAGFFLPSGGMMNGWAGYQAICCRLLGRAGLYQAGGAFGFRDQLQDAVNVLLLDPGYARNQILAACRHQYTEGDVMHWWHAHPAGDKGVRTRCSDDLVWLVWALCEYTEKTGDLALCGAEMAYAVSPPLAEEERDRYETPAPSDFTEPVLAHDVCAVVRSGPLLDRRAAHRQSLAHPRRHPGVPDGGRVLRADYGDPPFRPGPPAPSAGKTVREPRRGSGCGE